jgi:hypothetical protein
MLMRFELVPPHSKLWRQGDQGRVIRTHVYSENAKLFQQLGVLALPRTMAAS